MLEDTREANLPVRHISSHSIIFIEYEENQNLGIQFAWNSEIQKCRFHYFLSVGWNKSFKKLGSFARASGNVANISASVGRLHCNITNYLQDL